MSEDLHYFVTTLIASVSAFSLYRVLKSQTKISEKRKLINKITSTPIKSPDDELING